MSWQNNGWGKSSYNPGPTPQYAHPTGPLPQGNDPYAPGDGSTGGYAGGFEAEGYDGGRRFEPNKRIRDSFFLVLFIAQFAGFAVVSGLAIATWVSQDGLGGGVGSGNTGTSITLNKHTVYLLLFVSAAALAFSTLYLVFTRTFTKMVMHVTLLLSIALNLAVFGYYVYTGYISGAIIFGIIAVVSVLSYFGFRSRIPLAALLLQVVVDISEHHKSVYVVAFVGLLIQSALNIWLTFTTIATYNKWTPGNPSCNTGTSCSSGTVAGLIFFEIFSYYWTSEVINNVVLATLAGGPYGSWYYFGPKGQGMPDKPTRKAFVRASTSSLGSIAFGSLVVAIFDVIRLMLSALRQASVDNQNPIAAVFACCAECFFGCIQSMIQYFNRYAYIEIALYGKPYIPAARDTWRLFRDRGIDALVNDSLIGITMTWGAYIVGMISSLFGYLYLKYTHPAYNDQGQYTAPVILLAFLIGIQCSLTLTSAIEAGVSTIFVGLAEDPQVLAQRSPPLFEMIAQRYPRVVQGIPRV
ncbi:plasma-membrane choline transporter-domain-containing protein [Thelephora terrestris]|uniref:Protein PNS1 n=1 Tax=Thelephora terrestris TaxID=56493 RepID=A0A9P6HEE3_9AGAM|nr:plasma-membrane choline transporter-domain-containing protein [Thelephora terrestris]